MEKFFLKEILKIIILETKPHPLNSNNNCFRTGTDLCNYNVINIDRNRHKLRNCRDSLSEITLIRF